MSARRLVIHIGRPKCGSTSIQHYLASLDDRHRAMGVCYPLAHRTPSGYRNHRPLVGLQGRDLDEAIDRISREASANPDTRVIVVSAEGWSLSRNLESARRFGEGFCKRNPGCVAQALVYFRNPYAYIESCYAQMIKLGLLQVNATSFFSDTQGTIEDFVAAANISQGYPLTSIAEAVEVIRAGLGEIPVSFRSLESEDLGEAGLLADLCAVIGVPTVDSLSDSRRNTRLTPREITILRRARCVLTHDEFMELWKPILRRSARLATEDSALRVRGIHLGEDLAAMIRETVAREGYWLGDLFDTGVRGLCKDQWRAIDTDAVISLDQADAIIAKVRNRAAAAGVRGSA